MDVVKEIAKQVPVGAALIIVVALFVKFMQRMLDGHEKTTDKFADTVKDIHNENVQERKETREVIEKNTTVMTETAFVTKEMAKIIDRQNNK